MGILPRHKRSRRVPGKGDDRNKYIRCWNCNFICDTARLALPDRSGIEVSYETIPNTEQFLLGDEKRVQFSVVGSHIGEFVLRQTGPDGQPLPITRPMIGSAVAGCPLCGCTNLP